MNVLNLNKDFSEDVWKIIEHVSQTIVEPHFKSLTEDQIEKKANASLVTIADKQSEEKLTELLKALLPDSVVLGEEAYELDPTVANNLNSDGYCWVIDPIDGTLNFATKKDNFGILVALLKDGKTVGGWLYDVPKKRGFYGLHKQGVFKRDHSRVTTDPNYDFDETKLKGYTFKRYYENHPEPLQSKAHSVAQDFCENVFNPYASVIQYMDLITGDVDFILSTYMMPWDHAAGQFLLSELREEDDSIAIEALSNSKYSPQNKTWVLKEDLLVTALNPKVQDKILKRLRA